MATGLKPTRGGGTTTTGSLEGSTRARTPFSSRPTGATGRWGAWAAYLALLWFGGLMLRITGQYWPIRDDAAFLQIKQQYLAIGPWRLAFFVHVFTSMFALAAGLTQFSSRLRARWPALHRRVGWLYIVNVCLVTGPASLVMARYANGGRPSRLAFGTLAVLWIGTTAMGLVTARRRDWKGHREWMVRSFALTLSALTLRAWKWGLVLAFHPRPMDVYRLVAWLGFVPNLILAEWWLRRRRVRPEDRETRGPAPANPAL